MFRLDRARSMRDGVGAVIVGLVLVAPILLSPGIAFAGECGRFYVANTKTCGLAPSVTCTRTLIAPIRAANLSCNTTLAMSAMCSVVPDTPTVSVYRSRLVAVHAAASGNVNPRCQWNCGCGPVSLGTEHGLPVELSWSSQPMTAQTR